MRSGKLPIAAAVLSCVMLSGGSAFAAIFGTGAASIKSASQESGRDLTIQVEARHGVRAAPRIRSAPRISARPVFRAQPRVGQRIVRGPRVVLPRIVGGTTIIIGTGLPYDDYYPYDDPYYYEVPGYDDSAIAYCIQKYRSYDVRTRSYLGYDGLPHSCP